MNYSNLFEFAIISMFILAATNSLALDLTPDDQPPPPPIPDAFVDCFDQFPQRALSNAAPTGEFYNVSPEDCLRFCARDHFCHTMVYHRHFSTCQLYSGAKEGESSKEVGAKGHDLYSRKGAECGGNGGGEQLQQQKKDPKKEEAEKRPKGGAQQ